jgi:integrase
MARPPKLRALPIDVYWSTADNRWHGYLPTGKNDARGKPIRAHRTSTTPGPDGQAIVEQRLRDVEQELAAEAAEDAAARELAGYRPARGRTTYTTHAWLRYWLDEIAGAKLEYNSLRDYRYTVDLLLSHLPDVPLPELTSRMIDQTLKAIRKLGSTDKPNRAYRRLRTALNAAEARAPETGLWHNPIRAVSTPAAPEHEVDPLTVEEVRKVLAVAQDRERNGARWIVALALGLRQGEALSLRWEDIDLETGILWVRTNSYRRKWQHGCDDPHACGADRHKRLCPGRGAKHDRYHRHGCPPVRPCPPGCTGHAEFCEKAHGGVDKNGVRQPGGRVRKVPKSRSGRRPIRLRPPVVAALRAHRAAQDKEKLRAADRWRGDGTVFATRVGTMLNERDDWGEWKDVLTAALGDDSARLHDARHAAATMMLQKKVDPRVVVEVMGWSGMSAEAMKRRYQHVLPEMLDEAAAGVEDLIWGVPEGGSATTGATTAVVDLDSRRRHAR